MKCKACKSDRQIQQLGLCTECVEIRNEIRHDKQKEHLAISDNKDCTQCAFYKALNRSNSQFLCKLNYKAYAQTKPCFVFTEID